MLPRFKVLAECASMESWEKALALHAEMNSHGLELPPSELIEFIEVATHCSPTLWMPGDSLLMVQWQAVLRIVNSI